MVKLSFYLFLAVLGSSLLMFSGLLRYFHTGSLKEVFIGLLYLIANILIFCL